MKYPKILFYRKGKEAIVDIELPFLCQRPIFTLMRSSEMDAQLIVERLDKVLNEHFAEIKRAAYNAGYSDGRSKKKKKAHFYEDLDHNPESM